MKKAMNNLAFVFFKEEEEDMSNVRVLQLDRTAFREDVYPEFRPDLPLFHSIRCRKKRSKKYICSFLGYLAEVCGSGNREMAIYSAQEEEEYL
jgi:hypothetical protein